MVNTKAYQCWLQYDRIDDPKIAEELRPLASRIAVHGQSAVIRTAADELSGALTALLGTTPSTVQQLEGEAGIDIGTLAHMPDAARACAEAGAALGADGYMIRVVEAAGGRQVMLAGQSDRGALYAVFHFLRLLQAAAPLDGLCIIENPANPLRMLNHWDNMDGSIERGYAGRSIFYEAGRLTASTDRIRDYARLLASIGLNGIAINNVNVHDVETGLVTDSGLPIAARIAELFRPYGIRVFLSVNFASPVQIGGLSTADPLDAEVKRWWKQAADRIYRSIPDFGGFLVKADSEHRPGPFTYGRNHADGANMLAEALEPHRGIVIWRCFVYNCKQDWRDRMTDRARAAYDHFTPLDGNFRDNVILQIKNGPMDFQVREPVSPLFGALEKTNYMLELQITQEYTGQQRHLCYLVPQWKEVLNFETYARGAGSPVKAIASGAFFGNAHGGIAAVSNVGNDENWTGHLLAQANIYGYGRLAWNPELSAEAIADEWILQTFGGDSDVNRTVGELLLESWPVYERYTAPLGVGWMVNPHHHYGPNVDGYEYSVWGTYHYADRDGIGVDRSVRTGTGYAGQYFAGNSEVYESIDSCPDELLLFFHHVPYTHKLQSGKTVIQHIYDSHFEGVERVRHMLERWTALKGRIDDHRHEQVLVRLTEQLGHAKEWRDIINTYFCRKSGIPDERGRTIY